MNSMNSPRYGGGGPELRKSFKTPEGVYQLCLETSRHSQSIYGLERQSCRLTLATLENIHEHEHEHEHEQNNSINNEDDNDDDNNDDNNDIINEEEEEEENEDMGENENVESIENIENIESIEEEEEEEENANSTLYAIYNAGDRLIICKPDKRNNDTMKVIDFRRDAWPVCHSFASADDDADLLIGLSSGEVVLVSLKMTIENTTYSTMIMPLATFNGTYKIEDEVTCTAVCWASSKNPSQFIAAYSDGCLKIFDKVKSMPSANGRTANASRGVSPSEVIELDCGCIYDAVVSPDGSKLAVVSKDGLLRVFNTENKKLLTGFQSYYSALLCCAWSLDSKYIATGGEDDLVAIYSIEQKCVIAFGQGHNSWVTQVAFDYSIEPVQSDVNLPSPSAATQTRIYRVGSVSQDTQVALWDFEVDIIPDNDCLSAPSETAISSTPSPSTVIIQDNSQELGLLGIDEEQHQQQINHNHQHNYNHNYNHNDNYNYNDNYNDNYNEDNTINTNEDDDDDDDDDEMDIANGGLSRPLPMIDNSVITPSLPLREMIFVPPVMIHKLHNEPMSDIAFTKEYMFTCDCSSYIRSWKRPMDDDSDDVIGSNSSSSSSKE